jgi:hypothetical protein
VELRGAEAACGDYYTAAIATAGDLALLGRGLRD